jgi:hypothetical protein
MLVGVYIFLLAVSRYAQHSTMPATWNVLHVETGCSNVYIDMVLIFLHVLH